MSKYFETVNNIVSGPLLSLSTLYVASIQYMEAISPQATLMNIAQATNIVPASCNSSFVSSTAVLETFISTVNYNIATPVVVPKYDSLTYSSVQIPRYLHSNSSVATSGVLSNNFYVFTVGPNVPTMCALNDTILYTWFNASSSTTKVFEVQIISPVDTTITCNSFPNTAFQVNWWASVTMSYASSQTMTTILGDSWNQYSAKTNTLVSCLYYSNSIDTENALITVILLAIVSIFSVLSVLKQLLVTSCYNKSDITAVVRAT
jgi:hypothetical protein